LANYLLVKKIIHISGSKCNIIDEMSLNLLIIFDQYFGREDENIFAKENANVCFQRK